MNHYSEQVNNRSNYRKTLGDKHLEPSVMKLDSQCKHKTGLLAFQTRISLNWNARSSSLLWHQNDKVSHFNHWVNVLKMTPKWHQNDEKMSHQDAWNLMWMDFWSIRWMTKQWHKNDKVSHFNYRLNVLKMTQKWQSKPFQLPTECLENDTKMTLNDTEMTKKFDVNGFLINAMNDTKMTAIFTF